MYNKSEMIKLVKPLYDFYKMMHFFEYDHDRVKKDIRVSFDIHHADKFKSMKCMFWNEGRSIKKIINEIEGMLLLKIKDEFNNNVDYIILRFISIDPINYKNEYMHTALRSECLHLRVLVYKRKELDWSVVLRLR